jgi:hypothetical protein
LEQIWDGIAGTPVRWQTGSDSSDVLMNILGLHPTSSNFQRIGYSDEYLSNLHELQGQRPLSNELLRCFGDASLHDQLFLRNRPREMQPSGR